MLSMRFISVPGPLEFPEMSNPFDPRPLVELGQGWKTPLGKGVLLVLRVLARTVLGSALFKQVMVLVWPFPFCEVVDSVRKQKISYRSRCRKNSKYPFIKSKCLKNEEGNNA